MLDMKHIRNTVENFFLCTHIPIKAMGIDSNLIYSAGYEKKLEEVFYLNNIFTTCIDRLCQENEKSTVTIDCPEGIKFTASYICPRQTDIGLYIIGPYISSSIKDIGIIYKPSCCIPHIISLLHNIGSGITLVKAEESTHTPNYSLSVKKAIAYIKSNFHKPINLEDITAHININKSYFCTLFKKETGKTYSQFLNELRIEASKKLLIQRDLSIIDIALSVGFNNQNYFNMTFKKLTNKTPLEYRKSVSS